MCFGTWEWDNGDKYVGEYKDGKFNGQGTFTFADGRKDIGEWENDKLNGYSIQLKMMSFSMLKL